MPLTPTQRVRRSEAKSLAAGSRRIPSGMLPGDAADALNRLTAAQYAGSLPGVIARALIEADELMSPKRKRPPG